MLLERARDVMHRRPPHVHHDGDDVEPNADMRHAIAPVQQPVAGRLPKILLFGSGHGLLRLAVIRAAARFHFDEHHRARDIEHDDVQFAVAGSPIAAQYGPALPLKPGGGILFSERPELFGRQIAAAHHGRYAVQGRGGLRVGGGQHGLLKVGDGVAAGSCCGGCCNIHDSTVMGGVIEAQGQPANVDTMTRFGVLWIECG